MLEKLPKPDSVAHSTVATLLDGWLTALRRVAAVMDGRAVLQFVDGLLGRPETLGKSRRRLIAGLNGSTHLRRRHRLLVKMDQHASALLRMSLKIDLAMKNAERRGSVRSSGMKWQVIVGRRSCSKLLSQ